MSTINQCRACLKETFSDTSIFHLNLLFNENSTSFVECFFQCTNIQLDENEKNLPQKMCKSCIKSVIDMYQFRLMCHENDLQLKPKTLVKDVKEDFWETEYLYNVPKLSKKPFFYEMDEDELDEFDDEPIKDEIVEDFVDSFEINEFPEESEEELEEILPKKNEKKIFERVRIRCNQCKGTFFSKYLLKFFIDLKLILKLY